MYWQLTDEVFWGDYRSLSELKDRVGSVICLFDILPVAKARGF